MYQNINNLNNSQTFVCLNNCIQSLEHFHPFPSPTTTRAMISTWGFVIQTLGDLLFQVPEWRCFSSFYLLLLLLKYFTANLMRMKVNHLFQSKEIEVFDNVVVPQAKQCSKNLFCRS